MNSTCCKPRPQTFPRKYRKAAHLPKYRRELPEIKYDPALPIIEKKADIIRAIADYPVVIISGETGSGKTTQIPKFCLEAGRGTEGVIGCTQPRRLAAMTVAGRIAEELGESLGQTVGYKIRFTDRTSRQSLIRIMTDGILLAETLSDPSLNRYDTLIVDEAHERSLNIDFILGIVKTILQKRRNLKLIITSATIDTEKFSQAFNNAPIIEVPGRMYPVEVRYQPADSPALSDEAEEPAPVEHAVRILHSLCKREPRGDILVFMPTEQDIRETCEMIEGARYPNVTAFPLFARLSAADQARVFAPAIGRKIIVATNIAETSLTIPGIKYVVDTGLARISRYTPRSRTTSLQVMPISRSSADQRKGRCGRVENGVCIRLYSEEDYQSRPLYTRPEILRSNLAEVILKMMALKLGAVADFPFIDKPDSRSVRDGMDLLVELEAIEKVKKDSPKPAKNGIQPVESVAPSPSSPDAGFTLTHQGRLMSRIPIDPRLSRILLQARVEGCIPESVIITAALCIQDPRERPADKAQQADTMHRVFSDPLSDFIGLLNIWNQYHQLFSEGKNSSHLRKFCTRHFLSFKRMREWRDIHAQLSEIVNESALMISSSPAPSSASQPAENLSSGSKTSAFFSALEQAASQKAAKRPKSGTGQSAFSDRYSAIHRAIVSGFLSNIALKKEKNMFKAPRDKEVMIFPGSSLFNKAGNWIVAAEMVETSRLFARIVAAIDPKWLEELGKPLCRYSYSQPHWERSRGEVVALEQVTLFGLVIVSQRPVSFGRIQPMEASGIFIRSALVEGDIQKPFPFMTHNQNLIDDIRDMENRVRRKDILIGEEDLYEFYRQRIPDSIYDIRTFQKFLRGNGQECLCMTQEDILRYTPDPQELSQYPDQLKLGNHLFDCLYHFKPGSPEDGLTVQIPSKAVAVVPRDSLNWMVPGLFREKIEAMIKALPKTWRKQLVPISQSADIIVRNMPRGNGTLAHALSRFIYQRFGVDIPASAWSEDTLPDHLKMRIAITDSEGNIIHSGRDITVLEHQMPEPICQNALNSARKKWERAGIMSWDMETIPESIPVPGEGGTSGTLFPALSANKDGNHNGVMLLLFEDASEASTCHRSGVASLVEIMYPREMQFLRKYLTIPRHRILSAERWGGASKLQRKLYQTVLLRLFSRDIRAKDDFQALVEATLPTMHTYAVNLMNTCLDVIDTVVESRNIMDGLARNHPNNAVARQFWSSLADQLDTLAPEDFMIRYAPERFSCLIRYIRTIAIRAQRSWLDFEKDRVRAEEIRILSDRRQALADELSPYATDEKKAAVEELFWMIEEYKVSLYAQELKTAFPVSQKRIEKAFDAIDRMI